MLTGKHERSTITNATHDEVDAGLLTTTVLRERAECLDIEAVILIPENHVHNAGNGVGRDWSTGDRDQQQHCDGIVVWAGVGSRAIAAHLGDRVNIYPVKGYSITVNLDDAHSQAAAPWVSLLDDEAKIVTSRLGRKRFRIAGTAEFNGYNLDIRDDRIRPLRAWCETFFPDVSTEHCVPWAGLRPMLPSMMPRVGPGAKPGVYYNTGHGHLGWTLSAATAEATADIIDTHRMKNAA